MQKAAPGSTDRIAATFYSAAEYTIDLNLTDGKAHRVALYCLDWDGHNARAQRLEVHDAATIVFFVHGSIEILTHLPELDIGLINAKGLAAHSQMRPDTFIDFWGIPLNESEHGRVISSSERSRMIYSASR